jgi:phosphatidate cytidylyltransferase
MAPVALACLWLGGAAFDGLIGLLTIGVLVEWAQMARAGRAGPVVTLLGAAYVLLAAAGLLWLRAGPSHGRADLLVLLVLVWASDIGAYIAGRAIGGRRLAPHISPGKTVSGAIGGLLAATLVGVAATALLAGMQPAAALRAAALAALLGVVAQAGDLGESWVKRRFGVKDSGRLIPGHGGLLDRLDAVLAVALAACLLALMQGRGVGLWE